MRLETHALLRRTPKPAFQPGSIIQAGGRWLSHRGRPVRDVLVVNGHPDPAPERFCAALCEAYEFGARSRKRVTLRLNAGAVESATMDEALEQIHWAGMLVLVYPLWLDRMPTALNELIARAAETGLLKREGDRRRGPPDLRTIVTMDMPAFAHRDLCRKPGRSALTSDALAGLETERPTYIGCVNRLTEERRLEWLDTVRALGASDA